MSLNHLFAYLLREFPKILMCCSLMVSVGCAHYFPLKKNVDGSIGKKEITEYCIKESNASFGNGVISQEHERFGKFHGLMKRHYPEIRENCESSSSMRVTISETESSELGDIWVITFAIIPGSYYKKHEIRIEFDGSIFVESLEGRNVISLFAAPFFYWNKNGYDIIFDSVSSYIEKSRL